jgi:hypothetical protein
MARNRSLANRQLPTNLYCRDGYYAWRDPRTGTEYGLGRDKREAISQAIEANSHIAQPSARLIDRLSGKHSQTFGSWLERYDAILINRGLRPNSLSSVKSYLALAKATWANRQIAEISTMEVADLLQTWIAKDQKRMAQHVRSRLVDCFREAMAAGWVTQNPADITKVYGVKTKRSRLSLEQFQAIYAWSISPECKWTWLPRLLMLAILSGQRREDLSKLSLKNVKDGKLWVKQTKTGSPVALSLKLSLADFPDFTLGRVIDESRKLYDTDALIHHESNLGNAAAGSAVGLKTLSLAFSHARDAAGIIDENPPTLHEIRSLSGRLYEKQYGKDFAQALWGHKTAHTSAMYLDARGSEWVVVEPV